MAKIVKNPRVLDDLDVQKRFETICKTTFLTHFWSLYVVPLWTSILERFLVDFGVVFFGAKIDFKTKSKIGPVLDKKKGTLEASGHKEVLVKA